MGETESRRSCEVIGAGGRGFLRRVSGEFRFHPSKQSLNDVLAQIHPPSPLARVLLFNRRHPATALNTTLAQGKDEKMGQEVNVEEALQSGLRSGRVLFASRLLPWASRRLHSQTTWVFPEGLALATRLCRFFLGCPREFHGWLMPLAQPASRALRGLLFEHARQVSSAIFGGLLFLCLSHWICRSMRDSQIACHCAPRFVNPLRSMPWLGSCRVVGWCPVGEHAQVATC